MIDSVLLHLRKSRADLEAEARGEGETLAKHEQYLLKYAKEHNLNVVAIRRELESGEHLAHRPKMLETLREVEAGLYSAVLCMDIDRLGRGNKQDQGIILDTFKNSNTKIITPRKTYDLTNEWDEDFFDFEQYMAAKELKYINRRMQRGRMTSVENGNYIGSVPPYGCKVETRDRSRVLVPHPEQWVVVCMIFELYAHEDPNKRLGSTKIANHLNDLGYRSATGKDWTGPRVIDIIKNPAYAGLLRWGKRCRRKSTKIGVKTESYTRKEQDITLVKGKHNPLIPMEQYHRAQELIGKMYHPPYHIVNGIKNPLAGLVKCGVCGKTMSAQQAKRDSYLKCTKRGCPTKASKLRYVEDKITVALRHWLAEYEVKLAEENNALKKSASIEFYKKSLENLIKEKNTLHKQKNALHDLLEQGIYSKEDFLGRSRILLGKIADCEAQIDEVSQLIDRINLEKTLSDSIIPETKKVLDLYACATGVAEKNSLLKSILLYATYHKSKDQREDDFTIDIYPKIDKKI